MQILNETLAGISMGKKSSFQNLAITPLNTVLLREPDYLTLDEALASGTARVTEVSGDGHVPELRFVNDSDRAVLLLDGEELVGAKQNRILNLTILAPAKSAITIPVSCVEAGRWSHESPEFRSEERAYYAAGRARKAAHVTESLRRSGTRHSRQGEVWDDISMKSARLRSHSDTDAMASMYVDHSHLLDEYAHAFTAEHGQVGAVFLIGGQVRGLELFDCQQTFKMLMPKLVRSYALDAIDEQQLHHIDAVNATVNEFIGAVGKAETQTFASLGEGEDIRLSAPQLSGGALAARDRVVHLCAFRIGSAGESHINGDGHSMASASYRRRLRVRR
jgi:hypothetical protein